MEACRFCEIAQGKLASFVIFQDEHTMAFLDYRPLFPGHTLLIPKLHIETLMDLPENLLEPYFASAQKLSAAVVFGMKAEGCFVAMNNKVSQSVPHLHAHIVPRRKHDGMRGFFWPRQAYKDEEEIKSIQRAIQAALNKIR